MPLFTIIVYVTAALSAVALVLLATIFALNYLTGRQLARLSFLRSRMLPMLHQYVHGRAKAEAVLPELERDPKIALECLVETASGLPADQRPRLHELFEHFHFNETLIHEVQGRNWAKCIRAATSLGFTGNHDCVPDLMEALKAEMLDVRLAAGRALSQLGAGEAVEAILKGLALPGRLPQQNTTEILFEMGPEAIAPLEEFLRKQGAHNVEEAPALAVAARVLGLLKAASAAPVLVEVLLHPDSEVRLNAARALGLIGDRVAFDALAQSTSDPVWEVRNSAVQALGNLNEPRAIPAIVARLQDRAWWVRFNAAQSLFRLGDAGIQALKNAMISSLDAFARDISKQILEEHGIIAAEGAKP
jgi:HEAT repeat protein